MRCKRVPQRFAGKRNLGPLSRPTETESAFEQGPGDWYLEDFRSTEPVAHRAARQREMQTNVFVLYRRHRNAYASGYLGAGLSSAGVGQ